MEDLKAKIVDIRRESWAESPFSPAFVRGMQAIFGASTAGIVAWLQFSFSATASPAQIAMQPWLFLALICSGTGFALSPLMHLLIHIGDKSRANMHAEVAVRAQIKRENEATSIIPELLDARFRPLMDESYRRRDSARRMYKTAGRGWIGGYVICYVLIVVTAAFVGAALRDARNAAQESPEPPEAASSPTHLSR